MRSYLSKFSVVLVSASLVGGCTTFPEIDAALAAIIAGVQRQCKFVPDVFSVASLVGIPGAPQGEKLVNAICAAANKAKIETAEEQGKSGKISLMGRGSAFPAGVPLEFKVNGKTVSGVTSN